MIHWYNDQEYICHGEVIYCLTPPPSLTDHHFHSPDSTHRLARFFLSQNYHYYVFLWVFLMSPIYLDWCNIFRNFWWCDFKLIGSYYDNVCGVFETDNKHKDWDEITYMMMIWGSMLDIWQGLRSWIQFCLEASAKIRAPAIFPPAVLIFGLPTQKIC